MVSLPNHDAWESGAAHSAWLLDKIGLEKARTDFRYWQAPISLSSSVWTSGQAMQQKYSFSPPGLRHPPAHRHRPRPWPLSTRAPAPSPCSKSANFLSLPAHYSWPAAAGRLDCGKAQPNVVASGPFLVLTRLGSSHALRMSMSLAQIGCGEPQHLGAYAVLSDSS